MTSLVQALQVISGVLWLMPALYLSRYIVGAWGKRATRTTAIYARNACISWLMVGFVVRWLVWRHTAMRAVQVQGEAALWARISTLEDELRSERDRSEERITRLEARHAAALAELRAEFVADVSIARHDRNNTRQVLVYLLTRIKKIDHPDLQELAAEAEAMLSRGEETLALEKGAMKGRRL